MTRVRNIKILLWTMVAACSCWRHVHSFASIRQTTSSFSSSSLSLQMSMSSSSLVVISPPGGVGEVAAVKAAELGSAVRWFVVTSSSSSGSSNNKNKVVALSQSTREAMDRAGGTVELAGADAKAVLEDSESILKAVETWCASADGLVCAIDGVEQAGVGKIDEEDPKVVWKNAISLAARQASKNVRGVKLAILPAAEIEDESGAEGSGGGFFKTLLGGSKVEMPSSLSEAMGDGNVVKLRHGELFGIPESSPKFSALVGGPLKNAVLCEEYQMRSVRVDPSLSMSGAAGLGARSSRHAIGEAAALMALKKLDYPPSFDVCISSLGGTDPLTLEVWGAELDRVKSMIQSGQSAQLFTASFSSVPDVERLADWLATKWAPAVMRTYDIAAIRVGARPVYASRTGEGQVEIVWQQLDNFESVNAGKMIIEVSNEGLLATRGAGDASKGYGTISRKPLPGENILVSKLADAASQAIEKGLAKKPIAAKQPKQPAKKEKVEAAAATVTSVQSSGTVEQPSLETGPRVAGARRSSERARGKRRKAAAPKDDGGSDSFQ